MLKFRNKAIKGQDEEYIFKGSLYEIHLGYCLHNPKGQQFQGCNPNIH